MDLTIWPQVPMINQKNYYTCVSPDPSPLTPQLSSSSLFPARLVLHFQTCPKASTFAMKEAKGIPSSILFVSQSVMMATDCVLIATSLSGMIRSWHFAFKKRRSETA